MAERALAEKIASEMLLGSKSRILVRNAHFSFELADQLRSLMENVRFLEFSFREADPVRAGLRVYFLGSGLPDMKTAFDAGWRAHVTEVALAGGVDGMRTAAGLHSFRDELEEYLLDSSVNGDQTMLAAVFASFSKVLRTVLCLHDYLPQLPFEDPEAGLPTIIAFPRPYESIASPDTVIDSGLLSPSEVDAILVDQGCMVPRDRIVQATGARAGLVELFAGINMEFGLDGDDVFAMLNEVLERDTELASFALAAAVLSPGFSPDEAALASDTGTDACLRGKKINLWKGHLFCSFLSGEVMARMLSRAAEIEMNALLLRTSSAVVGCRGSSGPGFGLAGSLLARAGKNAEASEMYRMAAGAETCQLKKAGYFRTAAMFAACDREQLLYQAALCLYREDMTEEAAELVDSFRLDSFPEGAVLKAFCSGSADCPCPAGIPPELSPEILRSRAFFSRGLYGKAERELVQLAGRGGAFTPVALVEFGEQLGRRGMVEASLNVIRAAVLFSREDGLEWLETRALFAFVRACNRTGRFAAGRKGIDRLLELVPSSGNRKKLVAVYNLFANSMILQMNYEMALRIYSSSLRTLRDTKSSLRSVILNNMSIAQRRLFQTDEALGSLMRLVRVTVSEGSLLTAGVAYGNMARLFIDLSRFDSAEDCLESMIEFRSIAGASIDDSTLYISAQIAFFRGQRQEALELLGKAEELVRKSGDRRRLSLNLLKRGSMLLRMAEYRLASEVLAEAEAASESSNSELNAFVAEMKRIAARCFDGESEPWKLLCINLRGKPEETHRGEQYYYHWRLTGSLQSMTAAAQLLSSGLSHGLHFHSYLHMLHEIEQELPPSLADAIPLVHNYPSCDLSGR